MFVIRVLALLPLLCALTACDGGPKKTAEKKNDDAPETTTVVVMETSKGTVKIELFDSKSPTTVKNFLKYVDDKHYDGTIFHRVIKDFMIQGGGFLPGMKEKGSKYPPIENESKNGLRNEEFTLAMARTPHPHSATDQFFINTVDNPFLDSRNSEGGWGYAVFGKVIGGRDVITAIRFVQTDPRSPEKSVPIEDVIIKSIRRETP